MSTDKKDLQSDFIFPMIENPRSQHAVARGKIMRISTNIRALGNLSWQLLNTLFHKALKVKSW